MPEVDAYDYELPSELIAQHPLKRRDDARLLVVDRRRQHLEHAHVRDLAELLDPRDALVLNDTRVLPARLVGYRTRTGGRWQGLFLSEDERGLWRVIGKTRGQLTAGETVTLQDRQARDAGTLTMLALLEDGLWAVRPDDATGRAEEVLARVGRVPLPPYIRGGEMIDDDIRDYQTVYAETPGAVAAPTAGLHFTQPLLDRIASREVAICRATLHLGVGTFRPITARDLAAHAMHTEWGALDASTVALLAERRSRGGRTVAVGTSVVRLLETAARDGQLRAWSGRTDLFIRPPFTFHATDVLLTNFHLPRTTLLVLVRAFGGEALIRRAYQEAIRERYRFFSYGDAMLVV
jgi:S-adenosylmethionine:tRNA ribosyltransferase-isomerase